MYLPQYRREVLWLSHDPIPRVRETQPGAASDRGVLTGTPDGECPAGASQAEAPMRELAAYRATQPRGRAQTRGPRATRV